MAGDGGGGYKAGEDAGSGKAEEQKKGHLVPELNYSQQDFSKAVHRLSPDEYGGLVNELELVLRGAALGAGPVVGQVLKGGSGGDAVLFIADGWIIDVATYSAFISGHVISSFAFS